MQGKKRNPTSYLLSGKDFVWLKIPFSKKMLFFYPVLQRDQREIKVKTMNRSNLFIRNFEEANKYFSKRIQN